jgi:Arm DNA-binding domain/Phage integrase, N-terminal SAM-like domain
MRGSTVKRGRTWSYVFYLGRDSTGRKRQKWVGGFDTRRAAEDALVAALGKRRDGIAVDAGRMTVGQYLAEWLIGITPSLRPTTAQSYRNLMRDHVIRHIGNARLVDLTAPRIRMLHGELLENGRLDTQGGLSPTTVATVHRVLSHALKDAATAGLLPAQTGGDREATPSSAAAVAGVVGGTGAAVPPGGGRGPAVRPVGALGDDGPAAGGGSGVAVGRHRPRGGSTARPAFLQTAGY